MKERNNDTWANDDNIPFQRAVERSWMAGRYISVTGASKREKSREYARGWMDARREHSSGGGR